MWTSPNFKVTYKEYDLSDSGQGMSYHYAMFIENMVFINMVDYIEVDENQTFPTLFCEGCGFYDCAPHGDVALRRIGDFYFFIPPFYSYGRYSQNADYSKPGYLLKIWRELFTHEIFKNRGAFWLPRSDYDIFKKFVPALLQLESVNNMDVKELALLLKWDAPQKIFELLLTDNPVLTDYIRNISTKMNVDTFVLIVQEKLLELDNAVDFKLVPIDEMSNIITAITNGENHSEWKALYAKEGNYDLILGGTFRVIITKEK
jgi:hypothetical protein